jgi:hypothetical protein
MINASNSMNDDELNMVVGGTDWLGCAIAGAAIVAGCVAAPVTGTIIVIAVGATAVSLACSAMRIAEAVK